MSVCVFIQNPLLYRAPALRMKHLSFGTYWAVHYKLCNWIRQTNYCMCRRLNRFPIYALKPQYFKEQWSSLAKFPKCARITFQSGYLVMMENQFILLLIFARKQTRLRTFLPICDTFAQRGWFSRVKILFEVSLF